MKSFLVSWKTSLMGVLALVCGGTEVAGFLPDKYRGAATGICMVLMSLGLIAAKDANVSNAASPVQPRSTTSTVELPVGTPPAAKK